MSDQFDLVSMRKPNRHGVWEAMHGVIPQVLLDVVRLFLYAFSV